MFIVNGGKRIISVIRSEHKMLVDSMDRETRIIIVFVLLCFGVLYSIPLPKQPAPLCKICHCHKAQCSAQCGEENMCNLRCEGLCKQSTRRYARLGSSHGFQTSSPPQRRQPLPVRATLDLPYLICSPLSSAQGEGTWGLVPSIPKRSRVEARRSADCEHAKLCPRWTGIAALS